ncbi:MAG: nitrile hydratase accessory protein [Myxococcota bacterium]|nr:nitrile hydratase accessory protein [Myxococcota bacterium]
MKAELPETGPAAPPRANGELVFREPWESRAFGIAVSLHERGLFAWDEFRQQLIEEIGAWERAHPEAHTEALGYRYYERWLAALERVLAEKGLCAGAQLEARVAEFAARPAGHDH